MTTSLEYQSPSTRPAWTEARIYLLVIRIMVGYFSLSLLTLPILDWWWIGDLAVLALVQVPKLGLANWLLDHAAIPLIRMLGLSRGSISPDIILTRPYAMAAAYLIPLTLLLVIVGVRTRMSRSLGLWECVLVILAIIDFYCTFLFAHRPGLDIY
ncbi:MAG TPA: hypothetical protein VGP94_11380 [Tepidisphaeraceae bacterium]|nr:hypothetical protein [Tepidisphaeraceae bacterium]